MKKLGDVKQWFADNGDYTHRLNYDINKDSIVFDLGGYEGWFVEHISKKYDSNIYCFEPLSVFADRIKEKYSHNKKIRVYAKGISDENKKSLIYLNNDGSSTNIIVGQGIEIELTTIDKIMKDENIKFIDLLKINIEGDEYPLLEYMIKNNLHKSVRDIQVQFHRMGDYIPRYEKIRLELEKSHQLTYNYPFVWENWKLK